MRRLILTTLATLLGLAGMLPSQQAAAYEQEYFEMQRRIAQLEGLVADMQERQTARTTFASETKYLDDGAPNTGCTSCGGAGCDRCCQNICSSCKPADPSRIAIFEAGFIQPFATNGDAPTFGTAGTALTTLGVANTFAASAIPSTPTALGTFIAPRLTLGFKLPGPSGMVMRTRYFQFDHTNTLLTDAAANNLTARLRMQTWDVETAGTLVRGRHAGTMFGGFRYADFDALSRAFNAATDATARQGAYGAGITGGITGTSQFGRSGNFSINSGIRGSAVYGNVYASVLNNFTAVTPYQRTQIYNVFSIWEVTLGSTYKRPLRNGSTLLIGSSVEGQIWQNAGSLNPWSYVTTNPNGAAATGFAVTAPGSFVMLGFWNSLGIQF